MPPCTISDKAAAAIKYRARLLAGLLGKVYDKLEIFVIVYALRQVCLDRFSFVFYSESFSARNNFHQTGRARLDVEYITVNSFAALVIPNE